MASRIPLGRIPLKAFWPQVGLEMAQVASKLHLSCHLVGHFAALLRLAKRLFFFFGFVLARGGPCEYRLSPTPPASGQNFGNFELTTAVITA